MLDGYCLRIEALFASLPCNSLFESLLGAGLKLVPRLLTGNR